MDPSEDEDEGWLSLLLLLMSSVRKAGQKGFRLESTSSNNPSFDETDASKGTDRSSTVVKGSGNQSRPTLS